MANYFIETFTTNPWTNLAVEQVLAQRIGPGDVLLYLWQNERTVVIGRGQNAMRECRGPLLEAEGGYLARRMTGGGAVYHDLGNLCFTFAASPECYDLAKQLAVVREACAEFGIKTTASGRNDILTEDGYKFSGNAFSVTDTCKIQHGTIMIDVDRDMLQRYLTPSQLKLKAKGIQSVRSRVCNLKQLNPDVTVLGMRRALLKAFTNNYENVTVLSSEIEEDEDYKQQYALLSSWEWRYGRSPACEIVLEHLFSFGEIQFHIQLKKMKVEQCRVYTDSLDPSFSVIIERYLIDKTWRKECLFVGKDEDIDGIWYDTFEHISASMNLQEDQRRCVLEVMEWLSEQISE